MIEVIYFNDTDNEGLRIRKAKGTDDISGDYNEYKNVETVKVGDYDVTEKVMEKYFCCNLDRWDIFLCNRYR